jgi:phosphopantothenoylcysteine decarboxylase/phosphopantothenate--cysteine ligase
MAVLDGKRLVLGVTGGIAAYKAVELCRLFVKGGAVVRTVMTAAAKEFVTPLTFRSVSRGPVYTGMFDDVERYDHLHIGLAEWADLLVIAPATANCIGKIASGIADDLLTTVVTATRCPVLLAPAMNAAMCENPVIRGNLEKLRSLGYLVAEPEEGLLSCGATGRGRLAAVETIFEQAKAILGAEKMYEGLRVLVTAGPTREPLDPVRYLTNHSSGRMGYAIAAAAARFGADVVLVSGPTNLGRPYGVKVVEVMTAREMREAVMDHFEHSRVIVKAAAVADYRPGSESGSKIKKSGEMTVHLVRNPDILQELGVIKGERYLAGFAAETDDVRQNALDKLARKNLDLIVANDLTEPGAGFNVDTNVCRLIFRDGTEIPLPKMSKDQVAETILREIRKRYNAR